MKIQYWIMKSEPNDYSINDLKKDKRAIWDGVRNYQVRNMFRDQMKVGDRAFFYHSNTKPLGIVGEMKIVKNAETDETQFDKNALHYDAKSIKENPRWLAPTVGFVSKFSNTITLDELKADKKLTDMAIVKKGNRLSVVPITKQHYEQILKLSQKQNSAD